MTHVIIGIKSLSKLSSICAEFNTKTVMLVTGKASYSSSGAKGVVEEAFQDQTIVRFSDFNVNPKIEDAVRGAALAKEAGVDLIVGVGGGSVMDMAKLIKAFYCSRNNEAKLAAGLDKVIDPNIPIIAIPTTAGSGSEATHFAVVYIGSEKYSLAAQCLKPEVVILDGSLVTSGSKYLKICNSLDAMAQAIESFWSKGATDKSRALAADALNLGWKILPDFVMEKCSVEDAEKMLLASNLAGNAINISKTTAAHAWSYGFTSNKGIPHGHAVWLTLPMIYELHYQKSRYRNDNFGEVMDQLNELLGLKHTENKYGQLSTMLSELELPHDFSNLRISSHERKALASSVNSERMGNNPVSFQEADIKTIFQI